MNVGVLILLFISIISVLLAFRLFLWFVKQDGMWNKIAAVATILVIIGIIGIWLLLFYFKSIIC